MGGGGFLNPLLSNYPREFWLIWVKASLEKKKRVLVMVVYRSNYTQLHLENAGRRFCDDTCGNLRKKMAEGIISYSKNSSILSMTNS